LIISFVFFMSFVVNFYLALGALKFWILNPFPPPVAASLA